MRYTTEFKGSFELNRKLTHKLFKQLEDLANDEHHGLNLPSKYCQWVPTDDGLGIKWDGNEKFYEYVEWLQWIIDNILKPAKYELTGRVEFQGDDVSDHGFLVLEDDQHVRIESLPVVAEEFEELRRFKDFVLTGDYGDEITELWMEHNE